MKNIDLLLLTLPHARGNPIFQISTTTTSYAQSSLDIWMNLHRSVSELFSIELILLFILLLVLMYLILNYSRSYHKFRTLFYHTQIRLDLFSETVNLQKTVLKLPYRPSDYRFDVSQPNFFLDHSFCLTQLNWGNSVVITEIPTKRSITFDRSFILPPWKIKDISKIISSPNYTVLLTILDRKGNVNDILFYLVPKTKSEFPIKPTSPSIGTLYPMASLNTSTSECYSH